MLKRVTAAKTVACILMLLGVLLFVGSCKKSSSEDTSNQPEPEPAKNNNAGDDPGAPVATAGGEEKVVLALRRISGSRTSSRVRGSAHPFTFLAVARMSLRVGP